MENEILLSQKLIRIPSFSGQNPEVIEFLKSDLEKIGFKCEILEYDGDNSYKVNNLHAIYNPKNCEKTIYFAGHTDVVATGDLKAWKYDPFSATIDGEKLYGRGTSDMKCAIACFVQATKEFLAQNANPDFGIGFLITNDEESDSVNGTQKVLQWMKNRFPIWACIVGEPTNPSKLGEMIKIGRRGSINFEIKIIGKQGHVAYPDKASNPNTTLINLLQILKNHKFDDGNEFFLPTNLEITNIKSDNFGNNVIPKQAVANFNIRFNSLHNSASIVELVEYACKKTAEGLGSNYELSFRTSGESFLSEVGDFAYLVQNAVEKFTNIKPEFSTTGGTSDARFIKDFCKNVVECGLINETAHHIDEFSNVSDIKKLKEIYLEILKKF